MSVRLQRRANVEEPRPHRRIETKTHLERRVGREERLQRGPVGAGVGERQHMARADEPAIGVRAAAAELPLIDDDDLATGTPEIVSGMAAPTTAADDDDALGAGRHELRPQANGSFSSIKIVVSPVM